jgi:hypothetical protein
MFFNIKCKFWFFPQRLPEIFLILRRTERDVIKSVYWSSCELYPLFLPSFKEIWILSVDFLKIFKHQKFYEIPPSGSRFVPCGRTDERTNGQKDVAKLIVSFRNFANAPKQFFVFCNTRMAHKTQRVCKMQEVLVLNLEVHILTTRI